MKTLWLTILALLLGFATQAQTVLFTRSSAFTASGFDPTDYGTVALWTSPIVQGAGTVSQINDYSGNSRHFTQADSSKQPTYSATALGGYPAFVSDGTNDEMTSPSWTLPNSGTLMIVFEKVSASSFERLFEHGSIELELGAPGSGGAGYRLEIKGIAVETSTNLGVVLVTVNFTTSGADWWINGVAQTSIVSSSARVASLSYLFRYVGGGYNGAWNLGDIVIWDGTLSTGNRTSAQTALGAAYGLTL